MKNDEQPTKVINYADLQAWRARHPGSYFIGPVADPDVEEILPSWPFSSRQAHEEAERWVAELAWLEVYILDSRPPLDTPLDGPVVAAMERAARVVQRLELDVPGIWDMVDQEVRRLRVRPRR
jgi:hypothetical protein